MTDRQLTILIVDDTPSARDLLEAILTQAGHRSYVASGVGEALDALDSSPPFDLVLTDYNMPPATGVDLLRAVRRDARYRDLPVFVVSAETDPAVRTGTEAAGANGWLPKPICMPTLLSVVAAVARMTSGEGDLGIPTYRRIHR